MERGKGWVTVGDVLRAWLPGWLAAHGHRIPPGEQRKLERALEDPEEAEAGWWASVMEGER